MGFSYVKLIELAIACWENDETKTVFFFGGALFSGKPRIISSSRKSQHQTQQNTRIFQMYSMTDWSGTWLEKHPVYVQKITSVRSKKTFTGMVCPSCQSQDVTTIARPEFSIGQGKDIENTGGPYGSIMVHPFLPFQAGWENPSWPIPRGRWENLEENLNCGWKTFVSRRFSRLCIEIESWLQMVTLVTTCYNPVGKWCLNIDRSDRATPTSCTGTMAAMAAMAPL